MFKVTATRYAPLQDIKKNLSDLEFDCSSSNPMVQLHSPYMTSY